MNDVQQFPAIVDGLRSRKDGTMSITLGTQEMGPDQSSQIFAMANKLVWFAMSEAPIQKIDIPDEIQEFDNEKSPSERLRNVLYVYWDTKTDKSKDFETFRKSYMEKIINNIKDKLE